jgi:ribonucleoside-triphosphate reductase
MKKTKDAGNKVFDALAAPMRLQILRLVYSQGPLSYSEIMSRLNLNPNRDAGKFAYHLGKLHNAGLLATDEARKYTFTPLGSLMVEVTQNVEMESLKQHRKLLVRTSRLAMEEFDRNKIVKALMREAGVPSQLARKIAEETEERLLKLDTLYLTAPLIREFVNAILIEKGLHEYRHRHTRLGLPVYDVTQTIKRAQMSASGVQEVNTLIVKNVLTEYVLLDILPRRVADAHLDGSLHLKDIEDWILKPQSVQHDIRVFLRTGFDLERNESSTLALGPPKKLPEALAVVNSVLSGCAREVSGGQTVPHFNIFLAPFVRGVPEEELRAHLERFLVSLNQLSPSMNGSSISLGVDFSVPDQLGEMEAAQPEGRTSDQYGDFSDEVKRVAHSLIELLTEDANHRPVFSPCLIFNITRDDLTDRNVEDISTRAHELAAGRGVPIFTNLTPSWQKGALYDSNGVRLAATWTGDWELDTLRAGALGTVGINLPRIAYETKGSEAKFLNILDEHVSMAVEALRIKAATMENLFSSRLLAFLSKSVAEEKYLRLKNTSFIIGLIGLNEATKAWTGKQLHEDKGAVDFASKILRHLSVEARELSLKTGFRITLAHGAMDEASQRLAELDVERYGWGVVSTQGTRDAPYYTDLTAAPLEADIALRDRLLLEGAFQPLLGGGHLLPIELGEPQQDTQALMKTTREIVQVENVGAYTFTRTYGYCFNCKKIQGGHNQKCPDCGTAEAYTTFSRLSSSYSPLTRWPRSKAATLDERRRYRLTGS